MNVENKEGRLFVYRRDNVGENKEVCRTSALITWKLVLTIDRDRYKSVSNVVHDSRA